MPHIPLYVPDDVRDPDPKNAYINTIEHIDTEVGRLLKTLDDLELADNTYVLYTTDNGPWLPFRHHGGSAGPLREGKGTTFEGGRRAPCVMRSPEFLRAQSVMNSRARSMFCLRLRLFPVRLFPRVKRLMASMLPGYGRGLKRNLLAQNSCTTLHVVRSRVCAVRTGKFSCEKPRRGNAKPQVMLFNLAKDLGEQNNLAESKPDVVKRLQARMAELDGEILKNTPFSLAQGIGHSLFL